MTLRVQVVHDALPAPSHSAEGEPAVIAPAGEEIHSAEKPLEAPGEEPNVADKTAEALVPEVQASNNQEAKNVSSADAAASELGSSVEPISGVLPAPARTKSAAEEVAPDTQVPSPKAEPLAGEPRAYAQSYAPDVDSAASVAPPRQPQDAVPFAGGFWEIAKERPHELLDRLQRLLSEAQMKNERQVAERTYCMMALVHAARGDLPRALERLGQARSSALRRGGTAEVDRISDQVLKLLS